VLYFRDEFEKMGEVAQGRVDARTQVALQCDAKTGDPGIAVEAQAFAYEIIGTDEVGAETDLDKLRRKPRDLGCSTAHAGRTVRSGEAALGRARRTAEAVEASR